MFRVPKLSIQSKGAAIIDQIYKHGIVNELYSYDPDKLVYLKSSNEIDEVTFHQIVSFDNIESIVKAATSLETISPSIDLLEKTLKIVLNACFYSYFVVYFDHALYARAWINRLKCSGAQSARSRRKLEKCKIMQDNA